MEGREGGAQSYDFWPVCVTGLSVTPALQGFSPSHDTRYKKEMKRVTPFLQIGCGKTQLVRLTRKSLNSEDGKKWRGMGKLGMEGKL